MDSTNDTECACLGYPRKCTCSDSDYCLHNKNCKATFGGKPTCRCPGCSCKGCKMRLNTAAGNPYKDRIREVHKARCECGQSAWPLVRKVSLRSAKWTQLATGAVLVDAPGVNDDNSARDGIVKTYLKNADSIWIVSDIKCVSPARRPTCAQPAREPAPPPAPGGR